MKFKKDSVELKKYEEALNFYKDFVDTVINEKIIENKLKEKDYNRIAIFGMGRIGQNVFNALKKTDIEIGYVIDMNKAMMSGMWDGYECFHSKYKNLPKVDCIVVCSTVHNEEDMIQSIKQSVDFTVIGLSELLNIKM